MAEVATDTEGEKPRKQPGKDPKEVLDEYAQDVRRTALLDRLEQQLKGTQHVSRLLFCFSVADDKKTHHAVEQAFSTWRSALGAEAETLTGLLVFIGQVALHLLEGPPEMLFRALEACWNMGEEKPDAALVGRVGQPSNPEPAIKQVLASTNLRVLHFTELHGVRTSRSWCACIHSSKMQGGAQSVLDDSTCPELVFQVYNKLLTICLKVSEGVHGDKVEASQLASMYRSHAERMPTADEAATLLSKGGDYLFTYPEFAKVFIDPFDLVLHSELLWPLPPALSY